MSDHPQAILPDDGDDWLETIKVAFEAGNVNLAIRLLEWMNTRPLADLETFVTELRNMLEEVCNEFDRRKNEPV